MSYRCDRQSRTVSGLARSLQLDAVPAPQLDRVAAVLDLLAVQEPDATPPFGIARPS